MNEVEFAKAIESAAGSLSALEALDGTLNTAHLSDDVKGRLRTRLRNLIALAKKEKMSNQDEEENRRSASIFKRPRG